MAINPTPYRGLDAPSQPQHQAGRVADSPAVASFKIAGATTAAARRQQLLGFGVGSFSVGISALIAGNAAIMVIADGATPINVGMLLTFSGAAFFFGAGAINAFRSLVAATFDDIRNMTDLKIYAKTLQDANNKSPLRSSARHEGEGVQGRGVLPLDASYNGRKLQ